MPCCQSLGVESTGAVYMTGESCMWEHLIGMTCIDLPTQGQSTGDVHRPIKHGSFCLHEGACAPICSQGVTRVLPIINPYSSVGSQQATSSCYHPSNTQETFSGGRSTMNRFCWMSLFTVLTDFLARFESLTGRYIMFRYQYNLYTL